MASGGVGSVARMRSPQRLKPIFCGLVMSELKRCELLKNRTAAYSILSARLRLPKRANPKAHPISESASLAQELLH
jgi:hypothetical protein